MVMKNTTLFFIGLLIIGLSTETFAGNPTTEKAKAQFQFSTTDLTQNSWDYSLLNYKVTDTKTGESINIPTFLINYEVKDKTGNVVSMGTGKYLSLMDTKLGSEEDYTVEISTMINGEKVSQAIERKASPKKLAMKVDVNGANLESGALAKDELAYSVTRPKFNHPDQAENIQLGASDVELNIAMNGNTYKIDAGTNHPKISDQPGYQALKNDLDKLTAQGIATQMTIEPTLKLKGEVITDRPSLYDITANGISQVKTDEAVADK